MSLETVIARYYPEGQLRDLLIAHSSAVASKALEIIDRKHLDSIDRNFVFEAAMLHDIGIFLCNAPSIFCTGDRPYICHGIEGRKILEAEGLPRHALVCERHTGSGLTVNDIISQNLPLPRRDMLPVSEEEQIICYADKFFSKSASHPSVEKPIEGIIASFSCLGEEPLERFLTLHSKYS